ncbi:Clp protease N-terminal domain-containing protein [Actinomadura rupiterrae]|uniref:Clp protease N-terminal domain-containing protein n=1 Tax=Actinomadura rupiterrae TaxID=559627 RepID=UPI0020A42862|nr:Clp protease N-terminal domain-containing protein [Actinomadura rupiterrae]MCP2339281.1 D-alanyl-D-alanine carboxypeptidase [Actinomadura rupiterrae]
MSMFGSYLATVMELAAGEAQEAGSATIEAEHLLLAVASERRGTAHKVLREAGLDRQTIQRALEREFTHSLSTAGVTVEGGELPPPKRAAKRPSQLGTSAKLALERGVTAASDKQDLQPAHLLLGILQARVGPVPRALGLTGLDREDLVRRLQRAIAGDG